MDETFDKLNKEFNLSPNELPVLQQKFEEEKKALVEKIQTKEIKTIEDKEYLQSQIKSLITNAVEVLDILKKDIKIGTPAKQFEVYSYLLNSILNGVRELRDLNKMVADMTFIQNPELNAKPTEVNIKMTGKELLNMIKTAGSESQMNAIEAKFDIIGEEQPNGI